MRTEATLSTDNFYKPKVLKEYDAVYALLTRIIMIEPGSIPGNLEMGVGLVKNFRFSSSEDIGEIKQKITDQINKYLPEYQSVNVNVYIDTVQKLLCIEIELDGILYTFNTESNSNKSDDTVGLSTLSSGLYKEI